MKPLPSDLDPYAHDPGRWGNSLAADGELLFGTLDVVRPASLAEVGCYAGDFTRVLLRWAEPTGASVVAIEPYPQPALVALADERDDVDLVRATSHAGLREIDLPEAVVLDGDHNYWTVLTELRIIAERAGDGPFPLVLFHDVSWPHARRDEYEDPTTIPEEHRQPMVEGGGLFPGDPGIRPGGLPMPWSATQEGGPRNGVLTAVEDFAAERGGLATCVVPAFFGFGVLWPEDAPYAPQLHELLDPWDRNPLLERLEANRVHHLATNHVRMVQAARWQHRDQRKAALLQRLLISKSFAVAQRISRIRQGGEPAFSKAELQRLLDETAAGDDWPGVQE